MNKRFQAVKCLCAVVLLLYPAQLCAMIPAKELPPPHVKPVVAIELLPPNVKPVAAIELKAVAALEAPYGETVNIPPLIPPAEAIVLPVTTAVPAPARSYASLAPVKDSAEHNPSVY